MLQLYTVSGTHSLVIQIESLLYNNIILCTHVYMLILLCSASGVCDSLSKHCAHIIYICVIFVVASLLW